MSSKRSARTPAPKAPATVKPMATATTNGMAESVMRSPTRLNMRCACGGPRCGLAARQ